MNGSTSQAVRAEFSKPSEHAAGSGSAAPIAESGPHPGPDHPVPTPRREARSPSSSSEHDSAEDNQSGRHARGRRRRRLSKGKRRRVDSPDFAAFHRDIATILSNAFKKGTIPEAEYLRLLKVNKLQFTDDWRSSGSDVDMAGFQASASSSDVESRSTGTTDHNKSPGGRIVDAGEPSGSSTEEAGLGLIVHPSGPGMGSSRFMTPLLTVLSSPRRSFSVCGCCTAVDGCGQHAVSTHRHGFCDEDGNRRHCIDTRRGDLAHTPSRCASRY